MRLHIPNRHTPGGNSFGYFRVCEELRRSLRATSAYAEEAASADAIVQVMPAHSFVASAGAFNVLLTMFEAEFLPPEFVDRCRAAEMVIVPSEYNRRLFAAAGVVAEVCALGVAIDRFEMFHRERPAPDEPFRYLWAGAPNPRKGWRVLEQAWYRHLHANSSVELYVKTSAEEEAIRRAGNVTIDTRRLTDGEMAALYRSAHCFVFPSHGEGFGLTLAEAMATGLPAIFSNYGGPRDFADEHNAYPVPVRMIPVDYFGSNLAGAPEAEDVAARMHEVRSRYDTALAKGELAARAIAGRFSWQVSARTLRAAIARRLAVAG